MSNYYVHRNHDYDDELAHAFGFRKIGSQKPGHKYYAREGSPGHYLYFYSPAEYAAYKAGRTISKGAARVAGKATGVGKAAYSVVRKGAGRVAGGARSLATSAGKTVRALPGNARAVAGRAKEGVLDAGGNAVRALRGGAKAVGRTARRGVNAVNNASGNADRERANRLQAYAERQRIRAMNKEPASAERTKAFDQYYKAATAARGARKSYDNTLMGRAENTAKRAANSKAGQAIAGAAGKVRGAAGRAKNAVSGAAGKARSAAASVPGRVSGAAKTARNAVGSAANRAVNTVNDWRKRKKRKGTYT